jgi:hypothetical protein
MTSRSLIAIAGLWVPMDSHIVPQAAPWDGSAGLHRHRQPFCNLWQHFCNVLHVVVSLCVLSTSSSTSGSSSSSYLSTFLHLGYKIVHPVLENLSYP